jgi:uncharacterized protein
MRKILCIILLVFAPILAIGAEDKAYSIESVPNVYAQDRRLHVSDPNGLLMQETQAEINRMLTLLEDSTGIQSMVVMLPSIGHEDIFDFAHNLFRHWGIGNKESNNGMLIVYVADQRKIRFTTGYGLEGILPDAMCKRIQSRYMIPHFREGNTDLGMLEGTKAVVGVLDGSMKADNTEEEASLWEILLTLGAIMFIFVVPIWLIHRQEHTCPKCAKAGTLKLVSQTSTPTRKGKLIRKTLLCSNCGHTVVREYHQSNNDDTGAMMGGMMMGSMLGGGRRSGGGGFMGGSFGGGSTGGGGSTSGW